MGISRYQPPWKRVSDGVDVKGKNPQGISRDQLVPRMVKKARAAVDVDTKFFHFFQRKQVGRRCSCWSTETTAFGDCDICFGISPVLRQAAIPDETVSP